MKKLIKFSGVLVAVAMMIAGCKGIEPAEIPVKSVSLSQTSAEMVIGDQLPLDVTVSPSDATNKKVSWSSSKPDVANVSSTGIVEALAVGKAYITVESESGGCKARCEVTVKDKTIKVTGVALDKTSLKMTEGQEQALTATVTPDNASDKSVIWSSSNEAIVSVSEQGVVKALRKGNASVTATTTDGSFRASCEVTVDVEMAALTGEASHISVNAAKISGQAVLPEETGTDLEFGVLYSTSSGLLIGTATQIKAEVFDSEMKYTISTNLLEPSTKYYYRSYLTQKGNVLYGEVKSFETLAVADVIKTLDATNINPKDATLNGILNLPTYPYNEVEYGFEFNLEEGSTLVCKSDNLVNNAFSFVKEELARETEYSFCAYVMFDGKTFKGEPKAFTTASIQASVTAEASDVSYYSATISGKLSVTSEGTFTKSATLYYSTTKTTLPALKSNGTKQTISLASDGSYTTSLSSLKSETKYYYVVVSKVDDKEFVTDVKSFTTLIIQASVTAESSGVSYHSATISGKLSITSEGSFTKSAVLYYSTSASTLDALMSNGTQKTLTLATDGSYSASLSSLKSETKYYYAVVFKVDDKEFVTDVKSFTTLIIQASVSAEVSDIKYSTATISGKLSVSSEGSFTKSAVLYYSTSASTLDALKSNGTKQTLTLTTDGSYNTSLSLLKSGTKYYYAIVAKVDDVEFTSSVKSFTTKSLPEGPVDMGLSVKWASCNLGASKPEQYGRYFAWGDVVGQTWNGSSWSGGGFSSSPDYEVDSNNNLKPEYDAAHVLLGGNWRMPTEAEQQELKDNCTSEWTTYNGVEGRLFTSKKAGYTDKSIFLPAAGCGGNSYLYYAGSHGDYWSSTFDSDYSAWHLTFGSGDVITNGSNRSCGRSVRPVLEY